MEISTKETLEGNHDYLRVARTLRDKLDGLITSGATDLETRRKILFEASQELDLVLANQVTRRYDEMCSCTYSCCQHSLNPALWSTLPMELLQRVFANLPIPNICRLKSLSKEWKWSLQTSSSEFTLALKESSPKLVARVTWGGRFNFGLHVLDGRNNRWHELHVCFARGVSIATLRLMISSKDWFARGWVHMNGAADAGLVCYIRKNFKTGLNCIYVINPMTGVVNRLPNLNLVMYSNPTMMRIVVNCDTYHYKVIVVKHGPPVKAEVYDSEVQKWTKPKRSLGRIFGIAHDWSRNHHSIWGAHELGPCAYDCRDGKYYDFRHDQGKWLGEKVISYALMKDRLFVLYWKEEERAPFISEYCVAQNATSWVKEDTHSCPRISWQPNAPGLTTRIHACSGFVFVFVLQEDSIRCFNPHRKQENGWVYDLATSEWRPLPPVPWCSTLHLESFLTNVMCELHWNIRP